MDTQKKWAILAALALLASCGAKNDYQEAAAPSQQAAGDEAPASAFAPAERMADSTTSANGLGTVVSSSAAQEPSGATGQKFIRTADLRFKAKDVAEATMLVEDVTRSFSGYVTNTNLQRQVSRTNVTTVSADSSLETTYYTVTNSMVLRVPNDKLDTLLKSIISVIDVLDHRVITADEISMQLLANQMAQRRMEEHEGRLRTVIDTKARKLGETTDAEENLLNRRAQSDDSKLANLGLLEQSKLATVRLAIYQRESIRHELIANEPDIDEYRPNLGVQLLESLSKGWNAVAAVGLFIAQFWALLVLGIAGWIVYRRVAATAGADEPL